MPSTKMAEPQLPNDCPFDRLKRSEVNSHHYDNFRPYARFWKSNHNRGSHCLWSDSLDNLPAIRTGCQALGTLTCELTNMFLFLINLLNGIAQ